MIVMKFGGTSVAGSQAIRQAANIIVNSDNDKVLVVLSACSGITTRLMEIAKQSIIMSDNERNIKVNDIVQFHLDIVRELNIEDNNPVNDLCKSIGEEFRELCEGIALLGECTKRSFDRAASFGELFSSIILHAFLVTSGSSSTWMDARLLMKTDSEYMKASVDRSALQDQVRDILIPSFQQVQIIVTQGFIGSDSENYTTTLGRGGSDYSAALFGAALGAKEIVIWTDVSGIASADPRIIADAHFIESMSFDEARMLSFFGAKVLHPETILPALDLDIPVIVKNTFQPEAKGTTLTRRSEGKRFGIISVVGKQTVTLVKIRSMNHENVSKAEVFAFLSDIPGEILQMAGIEHSLYAIVDCTSKEVESRSDLLTGYTLECKQGSLISAIGPNFHAIESEESLRGFYTIVSQYDSHPVFISGLQSNTLSAFVDDSNTQILLKQLHGLCL